MQSIARRATHIATRHSHAHTVAALTSASRLTVATAAVPSSSATRIFSAATAAAATPSATRASTPTANATTRPSTGGTAIVMLNMGGPSSIPEVAPFLQRLFSDGEIITLGPLQKWLGPLIAKRRTPKIEEQYGRIGGSQIRKWTEIQGQAMVERLDKLSPETAPHKVSGEAK